MSLLHRHYIIGNRRQPTEEDVGGVTGREKLAGVNSLASGFNLKVLMVSLWNSKMIYSLSPLSLSFLPPPHLSLRLTLSPWFL
jgi:hypothetical protein